MSIRAPFRLSLALLGLTMFAPPTLAHANKYASSESSCAGSGCAPKTKTGLALDHGHKASSGLPAFKKVSGHIVTYAEDVKEAAVPVRRVDPIFGDVKGVPLGGKIAIETLGKPHEVTMPDGMERRVDGPAHVRKRANKKYNREVRKQIALAQNKTTIATVGADKISGSPDTAPGEAFAGKTVAINEPLAVKARTPLVVKVTDKFGRTQSTQIEAEGMQRYTNSEYTNQYRNVIRTTDRGGEVAGTMKPEVQTSNIRVSRPYMKDGVSYVKVFSAAAFTGNNAVVKVVNRETGETVPFKLSKAGAGAVEVPAFRKAELSLVVEYPAVPGKSLGEASEFHLQAPDYKSSSHGGHAAYEKVEVTQVR